LHKFSGGGGGGGGGSLTLKAKARQFSSYVLMVGRISNSTTFSPLNAIVVKDKDSLSIPLNIEHIPSPKEFKESISSLSDSQQSFAKQYRSLQLSDTLFGVVVLQIKPALERVLNLPRLSLTKEVSERSERAFWKTSILAMKCTKWLQQTQRLDPRRG